MIILILTVFALSRALWVWVMAGMSRITHHATMIAIIMLVYQASTWVSSQASSSSSSSLPWAMKNDVVPQWQHGWQANVHRSGMSETYADMYGITGYIQKIATCTLSSGKQWSVLFASNQPSTVDQSSILIDNCNYNRSKTATQRDSLTYITMNRRYASVETAKIDASSVYEWFNYTSSCTHFPYRTTTLISSCSYAWAVSLSTSSSSIQQQLLVVAAIRNTTQPVLMILDISKESRSTHRWSIPVCQLEIPFATQDVIVTTSNPPLSPLGIAIAVDQYDGHIIAMDVSSCRRLWVFAAWELDSEYAHWMSRSALSYDQQILYVLYQQKGTMTLSAIDIMTGSVVWYDEQVSNGGRAAAPIVIPFYSSVASNIRDVTDDNANDLLASSSQGECMVCYSTMSTVRCLSCQNGTHQWTYNWNVTHDNRGYSFIEPQSVMAYCPINHRLYITEGSYSLNLDFALFALDVNKNGSRNPWFRAPSTSSIRTPTNNLRISNQGNTLILTSNKVSLISLPCTNGKKCDMSRNTTKSEDIHTWWSDTHITSGILLDQWVHFFDPPYLIQWRSKLGCNIQTQSCSNHGSSLSICFVSLTSLLSFRSFEWLLLLGE
jgi:hypothetical protein